MLSNIVLDRVKDLPVKPKGVTLTGKHVRLVPVDLEWDLVPLFEMSDGRAIRLRDRQFDAYNANDLIWRYMGQGPFANEEELAAFLQPQIDSPNGICLCVFDNVSDRQVGIYNLMNNYPEHLKIELGSIWYSPVVQGLKLNTEATYLALKHLFGLGYRRVEWKCDALNERSRRAALRMGFKFEGIQEQHLIVKGQNRDTAWYRVLDKEWPTVQKTLEALLDT